MGRQRPREAQGQPAGGRAIKLLEAWLFSQSPFLTHSAVPAPMCKSGPRLASFMGALLPYCLGTMEHFTGVVTFSSPKINSDGILGPQVPDSESILIEMKLWEVQKKSKAYCGVFYQLAPSGRPAGPQARRMSTQGPWWEVPERTPSLKAQLQPVFQQLTQLITVC